MRIALYGEFILLWLSSMGWHLARILGCSPAYRNLSDTRGTFWSFAAMYLVAGVIRHSVVGDQSPVSVTISLCIYFGLLCVLFERANRSSALVVALLGASAVCDLLAALVALLGWLPETSHFWGLIELVISLAAVVQFHRAPKEVQQHGYGRVEME